MHGWGSTDLLDRALVDEGVGVRWHDIGHAPLDDALVEVARAVDGIAEVADELDDGRDRAVRRLEARVLQRREQRADGARVVGLDAENRGARAQRSCAAAVGGLTGLPRSSNIILSSIAPADLSF